MSDFKKRIRKVFPGAQVEFQSNKFRITSLLNPKSDLALSTGRHYQVEQVNQTGEWEILKKVARIRLEIEADKATMLEIEYYA